MDICRGIIDYPGDREAVTHGPQAEILAGKNHAGESAERLESGLAKEPLTKCHSRESA